MSRYGFDLPPDDHDLLRSALPGQVRDWVRRQFGAGARIVAAHPRGGGTSSAIHAVTVDDASGRRHPTVLRRYVRADWLAREPDLAEHEARVLGLLASTRVPSPRLVAVDPDGTECDVPAVLMTRLEGRVRWTSSRLDRYLTGLVDAMLSVHAVSVPAGIEIRPFEPYALGRELQPPVGTSCPDDWLRAIEAHAGPPPGRERAFIHRDFHPGNVLWSGDAVSGIVDWCNASVGSPDADVGHCRINLSYRLGYDAADRLLAIYLQRSKRDDYDPYWDLVTAVGMMGYGGLDPRALARNDHFVARAVARLG